MSDVAALNKIIGTAKVGETSLWYQREDALEMTADQTCRTWQRIHAGHGVANAAIAAAVLTWATPYAATIHGHEAIASRIGAWVQPLLDGAVFDRASRRLHAAVDEGVMPIAGIEEDLVSNEHVAAFAAATIDFDMGGVSFMAIASTESGERLFYVVIPAVDGVETTTIGVVPHDFGGDDDAETPEPVAPVPFEMA